MLGFLTGWITATHEWTTTQLLEMIYYLEMGGYISAGEAEFLKTAPIWLVELVISWRIGH